MDVSFVLINEESREDFVSVLPLEIDMSPFRVSVGAVDDEGRIVGAVSYILMRYEYALDWLFVEPELRRRGIGTALVDEVIKIIMKTGDLFPLSARFEFSYDRHELHTFFLSMKRLFITYSHDRYYVTKEDINGAEGLGRSANPEIVTELFFDKPVSEEKKILGMTVSKKAEQKVADYDLWKKSWVPELCRCVFLKKNLVDLIFMQKTPDGNLQLSYLYGKYPKGLFHLLSETVRDLEKLYPGVKLTFEAISDDSIKLAQHLFPEAKKTHIYEADFD